MLNQKMKRCCLLSLRIDHINKVYFDYKLKLKAYSKKRFDPFCRWDRISIPYKNGTSIETTIGQLNFFKWALENKVIEYIEENYETIEKDMNSRNSTSKRKENLSENAKTRTFNRYQGARNKIFWHEFISGANAKRTIGWAVFQG